MGTIKIVCFKWRHNGGYAMPSSIRNKYTSEHVNRLHGMVRKNLTLPHEFLCVTDDPKGINCRTIPLWDKCRYLGGCYNRLYVFSKDMKDIIGDRFMCIDLDVVITGNIDSIVAREEDFIINSFRSMNMRYEQYYNGALFMMDAGARDHVWTSFDPDTSPQLMAEARKERRLIGTDQAWISHALGRGEAMYVDADGVTSLLKLKDSNVVPDNIRMVFFSGPHDPTTSTEKAWVIRHYYNMPFYKKSKEVLPKVQNIFSDIINHSKTAEKKLLYCPDIIHPKSLNEKILWRKFFNRDRLLATTADKILVKSYARSVSDVEVIPTLAQGADPEEIPFDRLPTPYIVKPNHRSGAYYVMREYSRAARDKVVNKCKQWLLRGYGVDKYEWSYSQIEKKVFVEPLMDSKLLKDFKLFMFNGKCEFLYVGKNRESGIEHTYYTPEWTRLKVKTEKYKEGDYVPRPAMLSKMLEEAEKLARPFDFVRVDLYVIRGKVYIGELTHYPNSGMVPYEPCDFDFEMGKKLRLTL